MKIPPALAARTSAKSTKLAHGRRTRRARFSRSLTWRSPPAPPRRRARGRPTGSRHGDAALPQVLDPLLGSERVPDRVPPRPEHEEDPDEHEDRDAPSDVSDPAPRHERREEREQVLHPLRPGLARLVEPAFPPV